MGRPLSNNAASSLIEVSSGCGGRVRSAGAVGNPIAAICRTRQRRPPWRRNRSMASRDGGPVLGLDHITLAVAALDAAVAAYETLFAQGCEARVAAEGLDW